MFHLIKDSLKVIILSIVVLLSVYLVLAQGGWVEPTVAPPGGNAAAPLNTGSTGQSKTGGLILNTGGAVNGLIVSSGNVGIGTTNPTQALEVSGAVKVTGSAPATPAANTITKENIFKAWVNFDGTSAGCPSTNCAIRESFNVLRVIREGTGSYSVYWKTPFGNVNYAVTGACQRTDTAAASIMFQLGRGTIFYPFTSDKAYVGCGNYDGNPLDSGVVTVMAIGNQ